MENLHQLSTFLSIFYFVSKNCSCFSLPVKPSVDSGSKNIDCLPGSDAIKSVAPITVAPSNIFAAKLAASFVALPLYFLN